ncbi:MAG: hypothetical protein HQM15_07595 [Deltaproteobacteria bacterium]|nr:hypothetical protein [Deltaproteobacteria bacterium]
MKQKLIGCAVLALALLGGVRQGFAQCTITTVAGNGSNAFSGDGGLASSAELNHPVGLVFDSTGNLYFSDAYNYRIRKIDTSETITTFASNGTFGFSVDGFWDPKGLTFDREGNLYIADGNRVRKVDHITGTISTVAGIDTNDFYVYSMYSVDDGGLATITRLLNPSSVAFDNANNLYIAELDHWGSGKSRIRKVDHITGIISTIAGNGGYGCFGDSRPAINAQFRNPQGLVFDSADNLYILDDGCGVIRKIDTSGAITTVAYGLNNPLGFTIDRNGNFYIAEGISGASGNSIIRKVQHGTGIISTVAGNGTTGYSGDGGPATSAQLSQPQGVTLDSAGNLYIADWDNSRIRKVTCESTAPIPNLIYQQLPQPIPHFEPRPITPITPIINSRPVVQPVQQKNVWYNNLFNFFKK